MYGIAQFLTVPRVHPARICLQDTCARLALMMGSDASAPLCSWGGICKGAPPQWGLMHQVRFFPGAKSCTLNKWTRGFVVALVTS